MNFVCVFLIKSAARSSWLLKSNTSTTACLEDLRLRNLHRRRRRRLAGPAARMFRTVALFFALLFLFPLLALLVVLVALLLLVLLLVRVEAGRLERGLLGRGRHTLLVFVFLVFVLMLPRGGRLEVLVLFRELKEGKQLELRSWKEESGGSLTGPGCKRNPANCTLVRGRSSLPTIGGFSITLLRELLSCWREEEI